MLPVVMHPPLYVLYSHALSFYLLFTVHILFKQLLIETALLSIWLTFTGGYQIAQAVIYIVAPCISAYRITFIFRSQSYMCKPNLRLIILFRDFKTDFCVPPFM